MGSHSLLCVQRHRAESNFRGPREFFSKCEAKIEGRRLTSARNRAAETEGFFVLLTEDPVAESFVFN